MCNTSYAADDTSRLFDSPDAHVIFTQDVLNNTQTTLENVASCSPPMCFNVPNSSPQVPVAFDSQTSSSLYLHDPRALLPTTASPQITNQLMVLDNRTPDGINNDVYVAQERYFSAGGSIYKLGRDWVITLHETVTAGPFPPTPLVSASLGQTFCIGLICFYVHEDGRLYTAIDHPDQLGPKMVYDTADAAYIELYLAHSSTFPVSVSSGNSEPTDSPESSPDLGFDYLSMSPVSSESGASESSVESDFSQASLFTSAGAGEWTLDMDAILEDMLASESKLGPTSTPPTAPSSPPAIWDEATPAPARLTATKTEIDNYAEAIKCLRLKLKGSRTSQIQVKCPWCPWANKRASHPSELKEHMYAHRGLNEFRCPDNSCKHVSNRRSNLTRHVNKHHPDLAPEFKARRFK